MSKYKILLFDADATLLDFKRSEYVAVKECLEFFGLPSSDDIIEKYSEINDGYWKMLERREIVKSKLYVARWESFCEFFGFDISPKQISDRYINALMSTCHLIDGAEDICKKLYGKYRMYIVTNGQKKVQEGRLFPSPIFKYFDGCFISEDIGFEKPDTRFFDKVTSLIPDYDPQKAIIIGDSLTSDIKGGIAAGIDTCWYNPKGKAKPEDMEITYIVNDLSEIEKILE